MSCNSANITQEQHWNREKCLCVCVSVSSSLRHAGHVVTPFQYDALICSTVHRILSCHSNHITVFKKKFCKVIKHSIRQPSVLWNVLQCLCTIGHGSLCGCIRTEVSAGQWLLHSDQFTVSRNRSKTPSVCLSVCPSTLFTEGVIRFCWNHAAVLSETNPCKYIKFVHSVNFLYKLTPFIWPAGRTTNTNYTILRTSSNSTCENRTVWRSLHFAFTWCIAWDAIPSNLITGKACYAETSVMKLKRGFEYT